ncbi:MAG: uroporphyrinogen-III C-methyltransferase [Betaproteobacteria bacterium]|nr:uroporphyrinogen-III C-methyltransferase [Betaproteobacteria bacterium]
MEYAPAWARRPGVLRADTTLTLRTDATRTPGEGATRAPGKHFDRRPPGVAQNGTVYLVGAGPGDPDLLTVRAARLVASADVVVHDHLVGGEIVELARLDAQRIYVGKQSGRHAVSQARINRLLVDLAQRGMAVVRLKGGDPFIFGRGGEEIETLVDHGIPFEVVPGITAASGMAAYAGIPLTHRDYAQSCVFVTGHIKEGGGEPDWAALARPRQTVVIYMGMGALTQITRRLVDHGLPADTPAAVVRHATTAQQQVLTATLGTLAERVAASGIEPPGLIVVGEVVRLQAQMQWFRPETRNRAAIRQRQHS